MHSYPRNSPQAVARIIALVLISDGHVSRCELDALHTLDGMRRLGFDPQTLPAMVQTLCEDLLMEGFDGRSPMACIGDGLLQSMLAEVDDVPLQNMVLELAEQVVDADHYRADAETTLLAAIRRAWQTDLAPMYVARSSMCLDAHATCA